MADNVSKDQTVIQGDCLEVLKELTSNSIDSIVTDPPYGLSFMGKKWDYDVPSIEIWREVLRVLKPGGHLLSFGGTRTYHRMVVAIEDAGFEIRDQIQWLYGSGFPKSHNIKNGEFKGWGTALKPANEPICLARKPLEKGLTVAENVQKWGCGAINVEASRIGNEKRNNAQKDTSAWHANSFGANPQKGNGKITQVAGRWPANLILDEQAAEMLDGQTKNLHGAGFKRDGELRPTSQNIEFKGAIGINLQRFGDSGGASRFFYVAKASKRERNTGLEGMTKRISSTYDGNIDHDHGNRKLGANPDRPTELQQNHHPTVKPIALMEYLIRLVTPPGGIVLDPFCGSGTTGCAAKKLNFEFLGIELEADYVEIAKKRIEAA